MSAGDLAWGNFITPGARTVVGISQSGHTAATVAGTKAARAAGIPTIAITTNPSSPLAETATDTQLASAPSGVEVVPYAGYLALGLGVLAVCGADRDTGQHLSTAISGVKAAVNQTLSTLPPTIPSGISILTLPDFRSAGEFWALKLIEAVGLSVRSVPLAEAGHVDYFIGPQNHLVFQLVGQGQDRHYQLGRALRANGHHVVAVDLTFSAVSTTTTTDTAVTDLVAGTAGALIAHHAATLWNRPPFRGDAVDMSGSHISLPVGSSS